MRSPLELSTLVLYACAPVLAGWLVAAFYSK